MSKGESYGNASPTYPSLPSDMRLQEYALQFLLKEPAVDKIIVGASQVDQVMDAAEIVRDFEQIEMTESKS